MKSPTGVIMFAGVHDEQLNFTRFLPRTRTEILFTSPTVMPHLSNVGMFDAVCHRPTTPINDRVEAIRRRISALLINQRSSDNKVHRYCYLVVSAKTTPEKNTAGHWVPTLPQQCRKRSITHSPTTRGVLLSAVEGSWHAFTVRNRCAVP